MNPLRRRLPGVALGALAVLASGLGAGVASAQDMPYGLKPGKPYDGTTVTVMLPDAGQYRAQAKRLGELEELTGIKANYSYVPYGQLLDKITAEAMAGSDTYDLVTWQDTWGPSLSGFLDPLDDRVEEDGVDLSSYPQVFVDSATYKDALLGLPVRAQAQLLFYRKDLLDEAGVEPPTTMDELVGVARAVQEKSGISGIAMDYGKGNGFQNLFSWMNFMRGNGAEFLGEDGAVAFNSEAGVAATQQYLDILLKEKVAAPGSIQFVEGDKVSSMAQGNSAMVMVWWWGYSVLVGDRSTLKPEQVGFVAVPGFGNDTRSSIGQSMPFGIMSLSKEKDAAWEVLKWMANPDLEIDIATDKSDGANEIIVVHTDSLLDADVNDKNDGLEKVGHESLREAGTMPMLKTWPQAASVLEATISELASSGGDVQAALDEAASQVARIVRRSPE